MLNTGVSPFGNLMDTMSSFSFDQREYNAALVAAVAQAPVVQPRFNLKSVLLVIRTLYAFMGLTPINNQQSFLSSHYNK